LGDEKIRWAENVKNLEYLISNVIGDVLAASGFIAYLGPFTVGIFLCQIFQLLTLLKSMDFISNRVSTESR
jgi:hypothetical protein